MTCSRTLKSALCGAAAVLFFGMSAQAKPASPRLLTLYDAARGTPPDAQGWSLLTTGGVETGPGKMGKSGAADFSTMANDAIQGGYALLSPTPLRRQRGYALSFTLQVVAEDHSEPNRSGVSLIVLGADGIGLELAFWKNEIWAQSDKPLFHHAEGASFDAQGRLTHYVLSVKGDRYRLSANGISLLTGPLRDYRGFKGPISPYQTPNFLFLGDDSHAARGELRIAKITLQTDSKAR